MAERAIALFMVLLCACGHGHGGTPAARVPSIAVPETVTAATYDQAVRTLYGLDLDDPARPALRERILAHLGQRTQALVDADDFEAVVAHFAAMTDLFSPADFDAGRLSRELVAPARYLRARGSALGDEARVMSALLVLERLEDDAEKIASEYEQVARWGREARATIPNALNRYSRLIDVWEEHARLTPTTKVLRVTAQLHVDRQRTVLAAVRSEDGFDPELDPTARLRIFGAANALMQQAPFDVAAVYLQHGDVASALSHVEAMGDTSENQGHLIRALREALNESSGGTPLFEIAEAYRSRRPEVATGLCRLGLRRHKGDFRFPVCLARVAAEQDRVDRSTAWYADAVEMAPGERDLYDEALEQLNEFIRRRFRTADEGRAREVAKHAREMLEERMRRWPGSSPPIAPAELQLLIGRLEMNAGNGEAARRHFEASLEAEQNADALLNLGVLAQRAGDPDKAAELYRRALDLTPRRRDADLLVRAELLGHLGDAFREAGNVQQGLRMYSQALELWTSILGDIEGELLSEVQVHRGVLLDRLGEHDQAAAAFREALSLGSRSQGVYAGILSHLVTSEPAPELATEVFRRAQRELSLDPEWQVYFALWVAVVQGRAGGTVSVDVQQKLEGLARSSHWWGRLAKFGAGQLPYAELLAEAGDRGQKTEAHFYEAARRLARGDVGGARELFQLVLSTDMISFYEFTMAQELLAATQPAD